MSSRLLTRHFYASADKFSQKAALMEKTDGVYRSITYQEMKERVQQVAAFLIESGLAPQAKVALLSENRPEWPIADMGMISAGLVNVPIYPTLTAEQIEYILNDSDTQAIFVSKYFQLKKIAEIAHNCPQLKTVIIKDPTQGLEIPGVKIVSFKTVLEEGPALLEKHQATLQARLDQAQPQDLVSIVYTSGTTGHPKGVMLSHDNFASNAVGACKALGFSHDQISLSFLPLSHVLERVVNYTIQYCGATVAYAESIDTIAQNLQEVKPSAFVAVPRVFEKIYNRIISNIESEKPLKKKIFYWALDVGKQAATYLTENKPLPPLLAAKHNLAEKLVFKKIKARTGGNIVFAISGGAPLMRELAEFFFAVGIPIYEGYGLTETSPVITVNRPGAVRFGSVGKVIEDVTVKIAESDGEILAKGPNIMQGYYKNEEATREVMDEEGWFHTGDIGEIDAQGFLKITDRKKEIIVMSNGKNVAPQPIENALKTSPLIEQAVMLGNNEKYMAALIHPNAEALEQALHAKGFEVGSRADLFAHPEALALLRKEIDQATHAFARYEQIKKFAVIAEEMTQENGLLTPTLKYKRRLITERYQQEIDALFEEEVKV